MALTQAASLATAPAFAAGPGEVAGAGKGVAGYARHIEQHARRSVERYARASGWVNYELQVESWLPGQAESQPACGGAITVERARQEGRLWGRIPYVVGCSNPVWEVRGRAEVSVVVPVVTARHTIAKGELLDTSSMAFAKKDLAGVYGDFVTDMRQLSGQRAKRALRRGQVIALSQVDAPLLVARGDHVLIRVEAGGMLASMTGEALQDGVKGEGIKVRNHSSGKVITAWVAEKGIVETRF